MTLNLIESRIYDSPVSKANEPKKKKIIKLRFVNKDTDIINISKIINDQNLKKNYLNNSTKQKKFQQYLH